MSIPNRWDALVQESGGALPSQLKQFQIDTQTLLEAGRHTLVSVPCGAGKTIIQANGSRVMGGGQKCGDIREDIQEEKLLFFGHCPKVALTSPFHFGHP